MAGGRSVGAAAMEYSRDEGLRKYWDDFTAPFHKDGAGPLHKGQDASPPGQVG
jgi:beta-galactosidase